MPLYSLDTRGQLHPHLNHEWLLTNGLGGFASGTVVGCNTRRYHGLLCAALKPPVDRRMLLNRVGEILSYSDKPDQLMELSVNQFRGAMHPTGYRYLQRFELGDTARWEYDAEGIHVTRELQIVQGRNISGIRYTVTPPAGKKIRFQLLPFVSLRDFHWLRHEQASQYEVKQSAGQVEIKHHDLTLFLNLDAGTFQVQPDWWRGHVYPIETERGQEDSEDLYKPGQFVLEIDRPATFTLWAGCESVAGMNWEKELTRQFLASNPKSAIQNPKSAILRLSRAANDFVVQRTSPDGKPGTTIIAGYPWFSDWGRDTMIALPGLLLTTRRFDEARQVLSVFAQYVSEGMIPNNFDDYSSQPNYNTVDASLWFIHACSEYLKASGDQNTYDTTLRPACEAIVNGYRQGTRFKIRMDPADGLICQGDENTQLTWMDAKRDGVVFTPRQGKPVEINALWYHALRILKQDDLADKVETNFRRAFWINPYRGLADVVNNGQQDTSIRPNQIFAVSLPHSPLDEQQQQAVVEVVRRQLLTPCGLRTLARDDPRYRGRYEGALFQRDAAYHNGTVWPWPIGAFLDAFLNVNHHSSFAIDQARRWLFPLVDQLNQCCIGQINEIFDGDDPHYPRGCCAQAWSVAEVLRLAVELDMQ